MRKPKMLVHVCCAPDALYVAGLLKEAYEVTSFFYNPNIQPSKEYKTRLEEVRKAAAWLDIRLVEGPYDEEAWTSATRKFRDEPEKGRRCDVCYAWRLRETARTARDSGFDIFATVMSLSPWKKSETLNRIGKLFGARYHVPFLEADFKKKDGFRKSVELSRAHRLYRQDYCGCLTSKKVRDGKKDPPPEGPRSPQSRTRAERTEGKSIRNERR